MLRSRIRPVTRVLGCADGEMGDGMGWRAGVAELTVRRPTLIVPTNLRRGMVIGAMMIWGCAAAEVVDVVVNYSVEAAWGWWMECLRRRKRSVWGCRLR